jgi:hypothetical protein
MLPRPDTRVCVLLPICRGGSPPILRVLNPCFLIHSITGAIAKFGASWQSSELNGVSFFWTWIRRHPLDPQASLTSVLELRNVKKDEGANAEFLIVDTPPRLESKEVRELVGTNRSLRDPQPAGCLELDLLVFR